jgi:branched-chain amino acid transport system substrate-binding protein
VDRRAFLLTTGGLIAGARVGTAAPKETIKIVSSLPRRGRNTTDGIVNGIRLALEARKGEAGGFKIEYLDWDDGNADGRWTAEEEAANARKAINDADVMAVIGPYNSGAAAISMPRLNEAGLVQVSPAATAPSLTKKVAGLDGEPDRFRPAKRVTFCRTCPSDDVVGPLGAVFARDELKVRTVYVLDDGEFYGKMVATDFKTRCEGFKVKVLGHESIDSRSDDFAALAAKVKASAPDLVYFGGTAHTKGGPLAKDLAGAGVTVPFLAPAGCYEPAFIESAGEAVKSCYVTAGGVLPARLTGKGAEFVKTYKEKFREDPDPYAVYGYEAAGVVLAAIQRVGKRDREAIRKAVLATRDYDGILGKWGFDANGDNTLGHMTVFKVEKGEFVPVKVLSTK